MVVNKKPQRLLVLAFGMIFMLLCSAASAQQIYYPSPDEAVTALLEALKSESPEALRAIMGPEVEELESGDPVADKAATDLFLEKAAEANRVQPLGEDRAELLLGPEDWPFSVPLVKEAEGWRFDTTTGKEELANRRIGSNELHTIATARAFVEAQHEYAALNPMHEGVRQYAQRIHSREGKRDGLYWPAVEGGVESPFGPLVAQAVQEGYAEGSEGLPYHGYYYHLLKAQGANAPGGARSYLQDGYMTRGFGIIAYPAEYGRSGIMTFIINERGLLFQKDLGEGTENSAIAIIQYDPDPSWTPVAED